MLKTIVEVFQKIPQLPYSPHVQREGVIRQHCEGAWSPAHKLCGIEKGGWSDTGGRRKKKREGKDK